MNEIILDGEIGRSEGQVSLAFVRAALAAADPSQMLTVRIHSEGGSVFEGFAIHDEFEKYSGPKKAVIASSAFSIASFIPMAFDEIEITPNGYMMLHNPWAEMAGDDTEFQQQAELLRELKNRMIQGYSQKTGKSVEDIASILNRETFFSANQALEVGLVTRIASPQISASSRVFAKVNSLPHGVVAALFGAGSSGEKSEPTKEKTMSESQPVAASIDEIEAAFPKAKASFVLNCLKKKMPMASVAQAAVEEMMAENQELMAKCKAMEEELAKYKGMESEVEEDADEMAMEQEEEMAKAKAKARTRIAPVATPRRSTSGISAKVKWDSAFNTCLAKCNGDRAKAARMTNKENPGLREQMVAEANPK